MRDWREGLTGMEYLGWIIVQAAAIATSHGLMRLAVEPFSWAVFPFLAAAPLAASLLSEAEKRFSVFFWAFGFAGGMGLVIWGYLALNSHFRFAPEHVLHDLPLSPALVFLLYLVAARLCYDRSHLTEHHRKRTREELD